MKKRIIYLIGFFVLAGVSFVQCSEEPGNGLSSEQTAFLAKTTYGVYDSSDVFVYSEANCQYVLGVSSKSSRVQADDVSKVLGVTFSADPAVDSEMEVQLVTKGISGVSAGTAKVKVMEMKEGKIWIWDSASNKGYLLPWV